MGHIGHHNEALHHGPANLQQIVQLELNNTICTLVYMGGAQQLPRDALQFLWHPITQVLTFPEASKRQGIKSVTAAQTQRPEDKLGTTCQSRNSCEDG